MEKKEKNKKGLTKKQIMTNKLYLHYFDKLMRLRKKRDILIQYAVQRSDNEKKNMLLDKIKKYF